MSSFTPNNGGSGAFNSASALTPLTNGDSSPPTKITSPRSTAKISSTERSRAASPSSHAQSGSGARNTIRPEEKAITPIPTPPETKRQARPGPGEAKGFRCVYDPDLDKKLHGSERKKRKVHYREFGKETEHPAPPDPRLGIARYTLGAYHAKDSKSKTRLRPAPYLVKPYAFDPKISIGPGPATQVVVTGFDPFTPESQIRTLLGSYGGIAQVENRTDPSTGSFVGVCLVRYRDSKPARGPHVSAAAAARRAEKEGTGQRIGVRQVKIDRDREGHRTNRLVEAAVRRNRKAIEKVMAFESPIVTSSAPTPKPAATTPATPIEGPPPGAPKGPSGRPPPLGPRSSAAVRPANSLVEQEPVIDSLKREPYIFIAHCYVPVLGTTVPHLQRRMRMYHVEKVRCDKTGYYIIFQTSSRDLQWGPNEAVRCYHESNMKELFNCYVMNMELQQYGNPNYERSPTPERVEAERKEMEEKEQLEKEEREDLELEKQERATDLDPVCGALEKLRTQLKEKILDDIKTRIAVPTLYDFMDPERHVAKRRKLGISDPLNNENKRPALYFGKDDDSSAAGTPRSGVHGFASGPRRKPLAGYDMNAARSRQSLKPERLNAFADERRKKPPPRRTAIRPLFHRLQDFYQEDESDEERQASTARDTEDQESRPLSRMSRSSTPEQEEDDLEVPQSKKRRTERSEAGWGHESDDEGLDAAGRELLGHLIHKEIEDMANRELEQVVMTLPRSSKLHKRAHVEMLLRKKYAEDDELFGISTPEQKPDDTADEVIEKVSLVNNKVDQNDDAQHQKTSSNFNINLTFGAAPKTKKKTKKQLQEEREILKAAAKAMVEDEPTHKDVNLKEELEKKVDLLKEPAVEGRAEVEWGLSTETPRRTVEDDPDLVLDIDGWQHLVKDAEDLKFLQVTLKDIKPSDLGDVQLWAWNQKQMKDLNAPLRQAQPKAHQTTPSKSKARQAAKQQVTPMEAPRTLRQPIQIEGYYVPNSTGCARTEGVHKILNSEKSKYLPHRIRVQKEREERQNEAKKDPTQTAKIAAAAKATATQTSRTNRANTRRMVNDINTQKQAGGLGADSDAVRFNQLKKRKKLVKFDRSAIHNWGLYAEENIQAGDMIIEYVGEKIRHILSQVREARYVKQGIGSSYLFRIDDDMVIDATKKGGIARFINHSCSPNCTAKIINVEKTKRIVIYALRDIGKGEELTYDYKFEREIGNPDRIPCLCGSVNCKGFLN